MFFRRLFGNQNVINQDARALLRKSNRVWHFHTKGKL